MRESRVHGGGELLGARATPAVAGRRRGLLASALLIAGLAMLSPTGAAAFEPCGKAYSQKPLQLVAPGPPPLVIGDSIPGFAMNEIRRVGFRVNWQACRNFRRAVDVLAHIKQRRSGRLPDLVVLQAGTAGLVRMKQIRRARRLLGNQRQLGLVTPRQLGTGKDRKAGGRMRRAARRMRGVVLFDWARFSAGRDEWFYPDRAHPNEVGAEALAYFLHSGAFDRDGDTAPDPALPFLDFDVGKAVAGK